MEKRKSLYLDLKKNYDNGMETSQLPGGPEQWEMLKVEAAENGWDKVAVKAEDQPSARMEFAVPKKKIKQPVTHIEKMSVDDMVDTDK